MRPANSVVIPPKPRPPRLSEVPSPQGRFGAFGGAYVPETLVAALAQLTEIYDKVRNDAKFWDDLGELYRSFVGRATPLYRAGRAPDEAFLWISKTDRPA